MKKNKLSAGQRFFRFKATITVFGLVVLFLSLVIPALALETGLDYGTITGLGTQDLRVSIMRIVQVVLGFVGIIALIIILYAGYTWMTSAGNAEKIDRAKSILRNAIIGLIIILLAFSIVSFVISLLQGATGIGFPGPGGPLPAGCDNCGHLGSGIIESVYPAPFARDVARNTNIIVSFKVVMDPGTIIDGCASLPCTGNLISNNVLIYADSAGDGAKLDDEEVVATTSDGKTFIFNPVPFLGDGSGNVWYAVTLTGNIEKDNGQSAFPGVAGFFRWRFEVGTSLDIDPVEIDNVFPVPDDLSDTYTTFSPIQASGQINVTALPRVATSAGVSDPVITAGVISAAVSGSYNGSFTGVVTVTINSSPANTATVFWETGNSNNNAAAAISAGVVNLGGGISLVIDSGYAPGNQWGIFVTAEQNSDILRLGSVQYTFVSEQATGNQISVGSTLAATAANIRSKLNDNSLVIASGSGNIINLVAALAGSNGNNITIQATGSWAGISQMSGGQDVSLLASPSDVADKPRNAVIVLDFNEPIDPTRVNDSSIIVEYDASGSGNWQVVSGSRLISNQYKTVEFISDNACVDQSGNPLSNSCGDAIYCLPVIDPSPYSATHYRVTVKAGLLKLCDNDGECTDPNFNSCSIRDGASASACAGVFSSVPAFYPEAEVLVSPSDFGIIDAANNSFNGNNDIYVINGRVFGKADGPKAQSGWPAYSLNEESAATGDDLIWEFYINRNVDLTPPNIVSIGPAISEMDVSLLDPVEATFDELMLSSTLKPGNNYRDGLCSCAADSDCDQDAGEFCHPDRNKCVSETSQNYCLEDSECSGDNQCVNKKYVTLIDSSVQPVGWWITKAGEEVGIPDGFADRAKGFINHTKFLEITNYGAEFGSGIKDVFQNCYLPSAGPGVGGGDCAATPSEPYCCNGQALSQGAWAASACFTGY